MARLSKIHNVSDNNIPRSYSTELHSLDDASATLDKARLIFEEAKEDANLIANEDQVTGDHSQLQEEHDADDERGELVPERASISSLPESAYETEDEGGPVPARGELSTPRITRLKLRHGNAVQRVQVMSAPHLRSQSHRGSILSQNRSRNGTPRTLWSAQARGSPRPRKRISEATEAHDGSHEHYPLVLLHVTLLPVELPWSAEVVKAVLPEHTLANLKLAKAKVTETILNRGILIPHPREQYELLEEKLLEALELQDERVTKCGHFRNRDSTGSVSDSDSGFGSSTDSAAGELCATCDHHIKHASTAIGSEGRRWSVKVFAANGLMRSAAWTAAWSDMESVDVEILPWISEHMRRELDERMEQERASQEVAHKEDEAARIARIVEEQVYHALQEHRLREAETAEWRSDNHPPYEDDPIATPWRFPDAQKSGPIPHAETTPVHVRDDATLVDERPQIPISILLKNYAFLLVQDWRVITTIVSSLLMALMVSYLMIWPHLSGLSTVDHVIQHALPANVVQSVSQERSKIAPSLGSTPLAIGRDREPRAAGVQAKFVRRSIHRPRTRDDQSAYDRVPDLFAHDHDERMCPAVLNVDS